MRDGQITIGEILDYPPAKALLFKEYPAMANHPMLHRAGKINLNTAIALAGDALPPQKRATLLEVLMRL